MGQTIDSVTCGDDYTDAASIVDVWNSPGGGFLVTTNDVYMELQYGTLGLNSWTDPVHIAVADVGANGTFGPGTIGCRFRNYTPGKNAVVTANLSFNSEPVFQIQQTASTAPTTTSSMITGQIPATGTTPTAGSGFTYTHTNGTGVYVFMFNTPFGNTPTVLATALRGGSFIVATLSSISATGFTVTMVNPGVANGDEAFNFVAFTTV